MISVYFRELEKYTFEDVVENFGIKDKKEGIELIEKLKAYGIVKTIKINPNNRKLEDLNYDEIEILGENIDDKRKRYAFRYVGIITVPKYVIICYPKYIRSNKKPELEMKQILKVIKKYNSDEQKIKLYSENANEKSFNYLSMIIYLINDYYEHGTYSKEEQIVEVNGEGEILWDKTINETYAYILNNRPYYLELYTTNPINDGENYFTRLHQAILTECSGKLYEANLCEILDIEGVELSEASIDEFGEKEYILYRLEKELNEQYITKKQSILKSMYAYIANTKINAEGIGVCFYGTNHFNLVWEKVCSDVLDNKIDVKLKLLPLNGFDEHKEKTLKEIIEKPKWLMYEDSVERIAKRTLIPDLISIFKIEKEYKFAIFDAKYYYIEYSHKAIWGQPGIEDVTKQYLYQLAYEKFINKSGYKFAMNAFLVPTEDRNFSNVGQAKMNILAYMSSIELKNIEVIKLNAQEMYEDFINNKIITSEKTIGLLREEEKGEIDNTGIKIIRNSIGNLNVLECLKSKEIEVDEYSQVKERASEYLESDLLEKIAITFDRFFRTNENITLDEIREKANEIALEVGQDKFIINEKALNKLKEIYEEYYLVIY